MADQNEVKIFKQYLVDTNAFQALAATIALLHKSDPKPENPLTFIRQNLFGSAIDTEDFQCMKQSLDKLNADVTHLKADVLKVTNMVSKLLPGPMFADVEMTDQNTTIESMENNIGDCSRRSMPEDDSLIFNQNMDRKFMDSTDLNETAESTFRMDESSLVIDSSDSKENIDDSIAAFTMEFVEVDVVNQSKISVDLDTTTSKNDQSEDMQVDDTAVDPSDTLSATNTPDTTTSNEDTAMNGTETSIKIEELPIVIKEECSEEEHLTPQGTPPRSARALYGFDSDDVEESEKVLSTFTTGQSLTAVVEESNKDNDASTSIDSQVSTESDSTEPAEEANITTCEDQTMECVAKAEFVEEILDKVVESVLEDNVSGAPNDINNEPIEQIADKVYSAIPMLRDDPETELFLSFS